MHVSVLAVLLATQLPSDVPGREMAGGPSPGSWFQPGAEQAAEATCGVKSQMENLPLPAFSSFQMHICMFKRQTLWFLCILINTSIKSKGKLWERGH